MPPTADLQLPFLIRKMLKFEFATNFKIQVKTSASNNRTISLRGITREGQFSYNHTTNSAVAEVVETFAISDIPIYLTLEDTATGFSSGECYAVVSLLCNGTKIYEFFAGYIHGKYSLAYPPVDKEESGFSSGKTTTGSSGTPAAGAEITYTIPAQFAVKIKAFRFTLTTDATVANRIIHLVGTVNGSKVFDLISTVTQTASQAKVYSWVAGGGASATADDNDIYIPIPQDIILRPTETLKTETTGIQAGDQYTFAIVYVEQRILV